MSQKILRILVLALIPNLVFPQFQRMRIPSGTFDLIGNTASAIVQIPAACIDAYRAVPNFDNVFQYGSDAIKVSRVKNGIEETKSLNAAIEDKWIRLTGNETYKSVDFEVLDQNVESLKVIVPKGEAGVIGANRLDVKKAVDNLINKDDVLKEIDRLSEKIIVEDNPILLKHFEKVKQNLEWELLSSNEVLLKESVSELNSSLEDLKQLSDRIASVKSNIIAKTNYDNKTLSWLESMEDQTYETILQTDLGSNEVVKVINDLERNVLENAKSHSLVRIEEDGGVTVWNEGKKVSLKESTSTGDLQDALGQDWLTKYAHNTWFGDLMGYHSDIVLEGKLTDKHAQLFHEAGIKFVRSSDDAITKRFSKPKKIKLAFATSNDAKIASTLFGDQDLSSVMRINKQIEDSGHEMIESLDDLIYMIDNKSDDEQLLIVFHNSRGKITFPDGEIEMSVLSDYLEGISCNTYRNGSFGYESTGSVNFEKMAKSLLENHHNDPVIFDEFISNVHYTYTDLVAESNQKFLWITIGGISGISGGIYGIYEFNQNNE